MKQDTMVQTVQSMIAAQLHAHARDIKSKGAAYCDCSACAGARAIINA